jgi:hypothetical protein
MVQAHPAPQHGLCAAEEFYISVLFTSRVAFFPLLKKMTIYETDCLIIRPAFVFWYKIEVIYHFSNRVVR